MSNCDVRPRRAGGARERTALTNGISQWVCCQIGAREHYSIPRALQTRNLLGCLITDVWADEKSLMRWVSNVSLRDRFHPDLHAAPVHSWNLRALYFEARNRRRMRGWELIETRNAWFQERCLPVLQQIRSRQRGQVVLFAYSYAARMLFDFAKRAGWDTVLGQIDPGPFEDRLVGRLHGDLGGYQSSWAPAPESYWENWRDEIALADRVVVNSHWSRDALLAESVSPDKVHIVPLAYEPPAGARVFQRSYPRTFSAGRPLRVLFLGQANVRKGIKVLLDAAAELRSEPVRFRIVGPVQIAAPHANAVLDRVEWAGPVPRSRVAAEYRAADVFLFPSYSDGFGLTQLESQAWRLPVIASRCCGEVVSDRENGLLLPEVSAEAIATAIRLLLREPAFLESMSANSRIGPEFGLPHLAARLPEVIGTGSRIEC